MPASPDLDALAALLDTLASLPRYDPILKYVGSGDYFAVMDEDPGGDWLHRGPEIVALVNAAPALLARCRELEAALREAQRWALKRSESAGDDEEIERWLAHPGPAAGEPKL